MYRLNLSDLYDNVIIRCMELLFKIVKKDYRLVLPYFIDSKTTDLRNVMPSDLHVTHHTKTTHNKQYLNNRQKKYYNFRYYGSSYDMSLYRSFYVEFGSSKYYLYLMYFRNVVFVYRDPDFDNTYCLQSLITCVVDNNLTKT